MKTQNNPVGSGLGAQSGGWQDTGRDVVNPADDALLHTQSDLNPLPADDDADLDDEDEDIDLNGSLDDAGGNYAGPGDDDEIVPADTAHPEISDDRDSRIIQNPMMDDDPAEDPADDPYASMR